MFCLVLEIVGNSALKLLTLIHSFLIHVTFRHCSRPVYDSNFYTMKFSMFAALAVARLPRAFIYYLMPQPLSTTFFKFFYFFFEGPVRHFFDRFSGIPAFAFRCLRRVLSKNRFARVLKRNVASIYLCAGIVKCFFHQFSTFFRPVIYGLRQLFLLHLPFSYAMMMPRRVDIARQVS